VKLLRDLFGGPLVFALFIALVVFMMNKISAPDATYELGDYVIIVDLVLAFLFVMLAWGPLIGESRLSDVLPRIPSWISIPLGVLLFVFLYVSGLGEILLHLNEVASPIFALLVAACVLAGATYLDWRSPKVPDPRGDMAFRADRPPSTVPAEIEDELAAHGHEAHAEPVGAGAGASTSEGHPH
jgi:hypothetical protein